MFQEVASCHKTRAKIFALMKIFFAAAYLAFVHETTGLVYVRCLILMHKSPFV
jgi:hypothetical protein